MLCLVFWDARLLRSHKTDPLRGAKTDQRTPVVLTNLKNNIVHFEIPFPQIALFSHLTSFFSLSPEFPKNCSENSWKLNVCTVHSMIWDACLARALQEKPSSLKSWVLGRILLEPKKEMGQRGVNTFGLVFGLSCVVVFRVDGMRQMRGRHTLWDDSTRVLRLNLRCIFLQPTN